jgi:threonine aldolase
MSDAPIYFTSDNAAGMCPEVLQALIAANDGPAAAYGHDPLTQALEAQFAELFEYPVTVLLVSTGTAANALSLAALTPPWGSVLCHADSHIQHDECGAPEFFTAGAKLQPLAGARGKLCPDALAAALRQKKGDVHSVQPSAVSLTQATEVGSVYTLDELEAIGAVCRQAGVGLHMDGARFANALARLDCSPAEMTWQRGVDVLSFGASKNGAMAAEAIVVFDPGLARELAFRRKRAGHLLSKTRFCAAQLQGYLHDDAWLRHARHANAMAARLAHGLAAVPGVTLSAPVEANIVFCQLPEAVLSGLQAAGFMFYTGRWAPGVARLVTSFATREDEVDALLAEAGRLAG